MTAQMYASHLPYQCTNQGYPPNSIKYQRHAISRHHMRHPVCLKVRTVCLLLVSYVRHVLPMFTAMAFLTCSSTSSTRLSPKVKVDSPYKASLISLSPDQYYMSDNETTKSSRTNQLRSIHFHNIQYSQINQIASNSDPIVKSHANKEVPTLDITLSWSTYRTSLFLSINLLTLAFQPQLVITSISNA